MFYLGIDVGKFSHSLCLISDNDKDNVSIFQIDNTRAGFEKLSKKLNEINLNDLLIGMEATGHYFLNIYDFFLQCGLNQSQIALLNPLQVKSFRNTNLRGAKTDNVDAKQIATLLRFGEFKRCNVSVDDMMNLRELTRLRSDLVSNLSDVKRKIIAVVDRIFPEFGNTFSNRFGKTALELISKYSTPEELSGVSVDDLMDVVKKASRRGVSQSKIEKLHSDSRNSIGISFGLKAFKFELEILIERLRVFQKQIDSLESNIDEMFKKIDTHILSIPGVGKTTGATIISEIGNIQNFSSAIKLIAFAGLDPKSKESGTYQGKTPISKRGSKYLRNAIWYSAMVASRVNPTFREKYEERRKKGKSHRYAITAAANKLTKIIYHVLKYDCSFDPEKLV